MILIFINVGLFFTSGLSLALWLNERGKRILVEERWRTFRLAQKAEPTQP